MQVVRRYSQFIRRGQVSIHAFQQYAQLQGSPTHLHWLRRKQLETNVAGNAVNRQVCIDYYFKEVLKYQKIQHSELRTDSKLGDQEIVSWEEFSFKAHIQEVARFFFDVCNIPELQMSLTLARVVIGLLASTVLCKLYLWREQKRLQEIKRGTPKVRADLQVIGRTSHKLDELSRVQQYWKDELQDIKIKYKLV